jgi:opacity protein-like surface antigen
MKNLFKLLTIVALFAAAPAFAQTSFSVQYSMGFGMGDTKSFVSTSSFRGATMEFRKYVKPNLAVGADVSWNVFYERKPFDTYTSGTVSLSGLQYRYINAVPIYISTDYFFKPGERVNPFVGLGIGTLYTKQNTDMNLYSLEKDSWAFALRPEAGIMFEANPGMDLILAAKYNWGFSTDDLPAQSYLAINVGFVFKK